MHAKSEYFFLIKNIISESWKKKIGTLQIFYQNYFLNIFETFSQKVFTSFNMNLTFELIFCSGDFIVEGRNCFHGQGGVVLIQRLCLYIMRLLRSCYPLILISSSIKVHILCAIVKFRKSIYYAIFTTNLFWQKLEIQTSLKTRKANLFGQKLEIQISFIL